LVLDPENVEALVGLARVHSGSAGSHMVDDRGASFAAAEANLLKALSIAPQRAPAHLWLGNIEILTNRAAQGISECEHALALNRNLADAHRACASPGCRRGSSEMGQKRRSRPAQLFVRMPPKPALHCSLRTKCSTNGSHVSAWFSSRPDACLGPSSSQPTVLTGMPGPTSKCSE
jgi:hypothetical protein